MPFYDYQCDQCQHQMSVLQKRGAAGPGPCPVCQTGAMQKQILACSFKLSGTGWYKDGYGGDKAAESSASEA